MTFTAQGVQFAPLGAPIFSGYHQEPNAYANYSSGNVTAQGNAVGWETVNTVMTGGIDRGGSLADARLQTFIYWGAATGANDYRIDITAGSCNIRMAMGDSSYPHPQKAVFLDTTTVLATAVDSGSDVAASNWLDATGVVRTSVSDFVSNNAAVTATFATTIFRARFGNHYNGGDPNTTVNFLYIEPAASGTAVNPGAGTITFTGFAPTVARTANQAIAPSVGSIAFTGFSPTIAQGAGTQVNPGAASITFTGFVPTVARTLNTFIDPAAGTVTFTGFAPTVSQPVAINPGAATVSFTGFAPTVSQVMSVTAAESVTLTDSQNATVAGSASQRDESVTLTDSQSAILTAAAAAADSITLTDSVSATGLLSASVAESLTLSDSQAAAVVVSATRAESVTLTDSQDATIAPATNSQVDESITLTDSQSVVVTYAAARAESITLTDSASATGAFGHVVSESITITDSQKGSVPTPGIDNVDEFITLQEAQTSILLARGSVSDVISLIDSYSGAVGELPQTQRNLNLRRPLTRDRLRGIFGDHRAIKAFEQLDKDFAKLDEIIDGDGKIYGDAQRYGQDGQSAAVGNDPRFRRATYNASLQAQAIPTGVRTYIDGSDLTFYDGLIARATFTWRFSISKTASGASTSVFDIAFGEAGNVTDTARVAFTKPAGTAVADEGIIEILCTIEQVGVSGLVVGTFKLSHDSTVGHATTPIVVRTVASLPFDTSGITKAGLCITSGAGDVITLAHCQAKAEALT